MHIYDADHRLAVALHHGVTAFLADSLLRHSASAGFDEGYRARLGALATGALPSLTDAHSTRRCAMAILLRRRQDD